MMPLMPWQQPFVVQKFCDTINPLQLKNLGGAKMRYWAYWAGYVLFRMFFPLLFCFKITGKKNVPQKGPTIIAPNHISYLDPPLVGTAITMSSGRPVWFMAKTELFRNRLFGWLITCCHSYPVQRGKPDKRALKRSLELLAQGEMIVVFPEGTRSEDGHLQPPELGIALLALKSKAFVLPMAIIGSNKALPPHSFWIRPAKIEVRIGRPLVFSDFPNPPTRADLEQVAQTIMSEIAGLQKGGGRR
jgi:1-acyl-sn-glycerol-3-phosphate acyltransferase